MTKNHFRYDRLACHFAFYISVLDFSTFIISGESKDTITTMIVSKPPDEDNNAIAPPLLTPKIFDKVGSFKNKGVKYLSTNGPLIAIGIVPTN